MTFQQFKPRPVNNVAQFLARLSHRERAVATGLIGTALGGITDSTGNIAPELIAAALAGLIPNQGTALLSGGQVTWIEDYDYIVAAGTGFINGAPVSWVAQPVTLDAADPSFDRIDVIGIDSTGVVFAITGDATINPSEPVVDPATQLKLAIVTVEAGTSAPSAATTELLYADNVGDPPEWNWSTTGTGFDPNSTASPRSGTKAIEGTDVAENAIVQAEPDSGTFDPDDYEHLVFYLKFKAPWGTNRYLQVTLRNNGVLVGAPLRVSHGFFGLDQTATFYQIVIIPLLQFNVTAGAVFNQILFQAIGSDGDAIGCYIDDVSLRVGSIINVGTGMTQADADARYAQRALNLSDLTDAAAARANLGITPFNLTIREVDGTPSGTPTTLKFPNGSLTDNGDGSFTYALSPTSGGLYRAWTYTAFSAGEFTYVVDEDGNPVYSLQALEV